MVEIKGKGTMKNQPMAAVANDIVGSVRVFTREQIEDDSRETISRIRVFRMDDMEWWAGESLAVCVAEGRRQCGDKCYPNDPSEQYELSDEAMQRMEFSDEDGTTRTFAEELKRRIAAGDNFPQQFAAEDY